VAQGRPLLQRGRGGEASRGGQGHDAGGRLPHTLQGRPSLKTHLLFFRLVSSPGRPLLQRGRGGEAGRGGQGHDAGGRLTHTLQGRPSLKTHLLFLKIGERLPGDLSFSVAEVERPAVEDRGMMLEAANLTPFKADQV
jgi:hypothetical protein